MKDEIVIKWRCSAPKPKGFKGRLNRIITCSHEAVMTYEHGWVCDCGRWTKGDDGENDYIPRDSRLYGYPPDSNLRNHLCSAKKWELDMNLKQIEEEWREHSA
ncbi:MAG: hypothetical protein WC525_00880 [Candidatus Thermoplasmatota archaeon]